MFGRVILKRGTKPEGESPFWISFADLMMALMTLFLIVMAVTLIAVTKSVTAEEAAKIQREKDIRSVMARIRAESDAFRDVAVDEATYRIDLGAVVRFDSGNFDIQPNAAKFLRSYIPVLLHAKTTPEGEQWMRRVVVEGFTDQDGSYLYNLGLSLNRSRNVVCVLFAKPTGDEVHLSDEQFRQIQDLFLVGGYSFNSVLADKAASRRVELKIDFWGITDIQQKAVEDKRKDDLLQGKEIGKC